MTVSRARFCQLAMQQLGKPVLWNSDGPASFDCSGLVAWCLRGVGGPNLSATHNAQRFHDDTPDLSTFATAIDPEPGDLLFYGHDESHVTHVAILVSGGHVISADGATSRITRLTEAQANPHNRVTMHDTTNFRKDLPYQSCHRNAYLDMLDKGDLDA